MAETGLKRARQLMDQGFFYDNLEEMARCCREETGARSLVSAFVLQGVYTYLAQEMGDGPVIVTEIRKLEAKFRTIINLALEKALSGAPAEEQNSLLARLISLVRDSEEPR